MNTNEQTHLKVPDVAKRLGISAQTVYRWIRKGQLPALRIGRTVLVCLADIEQRNN
jgi:excisionase family DNA binding protein